jgi:hypothetical protein
MLSRSRPMDVTGRQGGGLGPAARGMLAAIVVSAVTGLAACGSTVPGGAGHTPAAGMSHSQGPTASASAGVPLCAAAQSVDRVVVSAMSGHVREVPPHGITIGGAPRVQALAAAICALPPMPAGLHCPADLGGALRLVFAAGGRSFHPVGVQESGCRTVTGAGPVRWWSRSARFGQLLDRTVGGPGRLMPGMYPSSVPTA